MLSNSISSTSQQPVKLNHYQYCSPPGFVLVKCLNINLASLKGVVANNKKNVAEC